MSEQELREQGNGGSHPAERQEEEAPPRQAAKDPAKARRTRIFIGAALLVLALAGFVWWLHARKFESTDDAQIDGNITAVSSRVPGTVTAVHADDNQQVKQGDLLVELDAADLQVSLAQARAAVALAQAQLQAEEPNVPITLTSNRTLVQTTQADLEGAQRDLDQAVANNRFAQQQLERARQLLSSKTIPQSEFDQRKSAADAAAAVVAATRKRIDERQARLREAQANAPRTLSAREAGLSVRQANLQLAKAQLEQAELNLGYARIVAPVGGIVGKRSVNLGDRIQPGQQLMSITQTADLWVTANFRETQIEHMRPGQKATVHVDAVDRDYQATVESFAGATGSRYSLLPPENASGNYVKVVQRIPVRLRFDQGQQELERLRPGMSAEPKVRVR